MDEDKTKDQKQESEEAEESTAETTEEQQTEESQEQSSEEQQTEETQEETQQEENSEESEEESQEQQPSRRQNKAIERLTRKLAEAQQQQQTPQLTKQEQQLIKEGEYTLEELNQMAQEHGEQRYKQGLSEAQQQMAALTFATRLEIDGPKVAQRYPILDENSSKFDPAVADYINRNYLKVVGFDPNTGAVQNPNIRYDEYAEATMEMIDAVASSRTADSQRNVARQAAKTGVRPGGVTKQPYKGADPRKMSDKQLEQVINQQLGITPR